MARESRTSLNKSDFLVIRSKTDDSILKIVSPQHFQIGFDDKEFHRILAVHGNVEATTVYAPSLSGSLTRLADGTTYLREGNNVTITTGSDGAVTIAAGTGALVGTLSGVEADGIQDFTYDGSGNASVKVDLYDRGGITFSSSGLGLNPNDVDSELAVTPASGDLLFIYDLDDPTARNVKKVSVSNLMAAGAGGTLANAITFGDGIYDSASGASSYNNTAAATIAVDLATNSGLEFSSNKLKADLDGPTLSVNSSGLSVASVPNALTHGTGISSFSYDGGTASVAVGIDTSTVPLLASSNTWSGTNTFGTLLGKHDEVSSGVPYLVGGSNVTISYDTPTSGQITIAASLGAGGDLTAGSGIGTFTYNGTGAATVGLDATSLSSAGTRSSSLFVSDGGTTITKSTVGTLVDLVDRTVLMAAASNGGINLNFQGAELPTLFSIDLDGSTLSIGNNGISVANLPYAISQGTGIDTFSFDGSSTQTVAIDTAVVPRKGVDNTWTGKNTFGISTTAGLTGSLQEVSSGVPYLACGTGVSIVTSSNGQIVVSTDGTEITGVTAGQGLTGGGASGDVTLAVDLASTAGLEFSSDKLRVKLDGSTIDMGSSGISVANVPNSLAQGTGISTFTYDGGTSGITVGIDNSVVATLTGSQFSGPVVFNAGLSGSLTRLPDGTSYLRQGDNVTITTGSSGEITISAIAGGGGVADGNAQYLVLAATSSLAQERVITMGTGLASSDDGAGNAYTLRVKDSEFAALTGSIFSGDVVAQAGLSGSLQALSDGTSYLREGSNIAIASSSAGYVTVSSTDTTYTAGSGLDLSGTAFSVDLKSGSGLVIDSAELSIDDSVLATITGSTFTGTVTAPALSGSLTRLQDGTSYLRPGNANVIITSASAGYISISSTDTDTTYTAGDGLDLSGTEFSVDLKSNSGLVIDSTELSIDDSIIATITGSTFTGTVTAPALSGSLTKLQDGTSYLIAGSNVTITTGSSGAVTVAASGGEISVVSGSSSVSSISTLNLSKLGVISDLGGGVVAVTGSIGDAEDGSYSDGLFTDFSTVTPVGTAVDRFNEVLKGLAPSAAPGLDDMNCSDSGTSAVLSFGSSQSISGYTNARPSTLTPTDNLSDIDINGTFNSTAASNDLRRACFGGSTVINGTLNADVSADGVNYAAYSFGNGNQGTLKLFVNDNSTAIHSVDLSSFGSGNSLNGNGSGFNLSATTPGHFSDSSNFETFQHRQGTYTITAADQQSGWNYARVVHTIAGADITCNYVEWVNDPDSNALSSDNSAMDSLSMTGTKNLSGVKYNTGGTAEYRIRVLNAYRNVYSTSTISFNGTNCSVSSQAFPSINHAGGEDETKILHLTGSATITGDPILDGSISVSTNVPAPLKSNLSSAGSQSISGILLYDLSDTSTATSETFRGESYRLISGSYNTQANVTAGGSAWDSTTSLAGVDGLLFYNSRLYAPPQGGDSGDFRNTSDGGSITNGPSSNVNYSGITSGTRTFYRYFQNTSGGSKTGFDLTINGSGTIASQATTLTTSNLHVLIKLPTTTAAFETGWMDLAISFATGQTSDGDGCLDGSLDSSLNATNTATFGTQSVGSNEYIVVKIEADASSTGYISSMSVSWS